MGHTAYIGIGSNIGDKINLCKKAISEILRLDSNKIIAKSSLYKTKPIGFTDQDWFVNGVIKIETELKPLDLLYGLKNIEFHLGRKRTFHWGPRTIDLDILLFDERVITTGELKIPHPHLHERQFVLVPLVEIDRNIFHPIFKKTVGELLEDLIEDQGVEKISDI